MNIVVDSGNTTVKVGIFEAGRLADRPVFGNTSELKSFLKNNPTENILVSSVSTSADEILSWCSATGKKISLTPQVSLPVKIQYATPQTLGVDRIAAVCGAMELFPARNCLVIDAGTCITYEYLDSDGSYHGGGISPGIMMRFEAMHNFTSRLPLIKPALKVPLVGNSTETSMQSGVILGVRMEAEGIIKKYSQLYQNLQVVLCGGDASFFENHLEATIFVAPDLVLIGLNRILKHVIST